MDDAGLNHPDLTLYTSADNWLAGATPDIIPQIVLLLYNGRV